MKFKILVSILTIIIVALFAIAITLTYKLEEKRAKLIVAKKELEKSVNDLQLSRDSLETVMKKLSVWEKSDQDLRNKQLKRHKYTLGIDVQANNEKYQKLIGFLVNTGFELEYVNQKRLGISTRQPTIYYYSDKGKEIAEELKADLEKKFPNMSKITEVQRGKSSNQGNLLTMKLRFKK